jgi:hypothetical protein
MVDTNEKYLKVLGAWYDYDRYPASEGDGKVILDNTPPTVISFFP